MPLATVLLTPWALFQGASEEVIERAKEDGDEDILTQNGNALEVSKRQRIRVEDMALSNLDGDHQQLETLHPKSLLSKGYR